MNYNANVISPNLKKKQEKSPMRFGKRRYDQSPTNQNRISPDFSLKIHNCDWLIIESLTNNIQNLSLFISKKANFALRAFI